MTEKLTLEKFQIGQSIPLHPCQGWPKAAVHHFDLAQAIAVLAAKQINRPLLVRGEPGCGKTQMARAVAQVLGMPLATLVVNERTEMEDLFWRYDALKRLSDANDPNKGVQSEKQYLSAGPLWWALNAGLATSHEGSHSQHPDMGGEGHRRDFGNGVLLLIDEIDKADRSVPNSLLEALGNFSFQVPYISQRVEMSGEPPLIVITTNQEQDLPPAFERRCLVLDLSLPDELEPFVQTLTKRGKALFKYQLDDDIYKDTATAVWEKREALKDAGGNRMPGQAEYLDHLEAILAVSAIGTGEGEQTPAEILADLTYLKYRA